MLKEDSIIVKPIDTKRVIELITKAVPPAANVTYKMHSEAILKEPGIEDTENCITDNECIYHLVPHRFIDGKTQLTYTVEVRTTTKTELGTSHAATPKFLYDIPMEQLKEMLLPEVTLREFMGRRYNYNPRIEKNMREFIEVVES